jgi:hypothetical protein
MQVIMLDEDGQAAPGLHHSLDCPLCLTITTPPSYSSPHLEQPQPLGLALQPVVSARIAALVGAPCPREGRQRSCKSTVPPIDGGYSYRRRAQSCTADFTCTQIVHDPSLLWRDAQWQREFSFARLFQRNSVALAVAHLSLAVPLAVASSASWAQTDVTLDTVTVRSSGDTPLERSVGTGSRLDLNARDTPASVEVTTREQLEARGDTSLVDAITRSTGITSLGHPGNSGSALSARGFTDSTSVMRLYDGTRQYGVGVSFPFDTWSIDRIEVLRGPASVIYGDGAIGGVVNVIPKSPRAGLFKMKSRPRWEPKANVHWPLAAQARSMSNGPIDWMSVATNRMAGWIVAIPAIGRSPALCAGM